MFIKFLVREFYENLSSDFCFYLNETSLIAILHEHPHDVCARMSLLSAQRNQLGLIHPQLRYMPRQRSNICKMYDCLFNIWSYVFSTSNTNICYSEFL
jgi:hypothetical protein